MKQFILIVLLVVVYNPGSAQQVADTTYRPDIRRPAYKPGEGPVVLVDEGHHNFHTAGGRYLPFARLLERDGYVVKPYTGAFQADLLGEGKILVISNALNELNVTRWHLPVLSAFDEEEITAVSSWVREGGSLFLIADHMPMGGAARELASRFGFEFSNGFAYDTSFDGTILFDLEEGSLQKSILTRGRRRYERVSRVVSFTGQGFRIPEEATPVLQFKQGSVNLLPDTAWVFDDQTRRESIDGWCQGAFRTFGRGKVVVFGEAAMFTAQLAGPEMRRAGMNHPIAPENYQLLLNIIHWLDGKLD